MINWNRVQELRDDFGEEDFLEISKVFLEEVEGRLDALKSQEDSKLSEDFHFLKGSAANLGFRALQHACQTAEANPDKGCVPAIKGIYLQSKLEFLSDAERLGRVA